ncbi:MAG: hypothetical protein AAGK97_19125, partial [Bacteroidota bacterium]
PTHPIFNHTATTHIYTILHTLSLHDASDLSKIIQIRTGTDVALYEPINHISFQYVERQPKKVRKTSFGSKAHSSYKNCPKLLKLELVLSPLHTRLNIKFHLDRLKANRKKSGKHNLGRPDGRTIA